MDTSHQSTTESPRRRISMKQKSLVAMEPDDDKESDDNENELKNRRLEAINKSTTLKRRSVAALFSVNMNPGQLAQHCKDCIKLSTENKINSKNAFSFLLIDAMAAMAKKSDSEISQNFQVATSTLDASVKIYGYRVDAVHTDAMKMAGGLLNKEIQQALDDNDENEETNEDPTKITIAKKRKRKYTVVAASTLNAKSESEVLLDVPPKKTMLTRGGEGTQLLTSIPKYNDSCLFMVEADTTCWPFDGKQKPMPQFSVPEDLNIQAIMDVFSEIPINPGDKLCEAASDIKFGADCEEEPDLEVSQISAFEFDVDASVQDADYDEPPAPPPRLALPCGGYDSGDDIALPEQPMKSSAPTTITELTRRLSLQNREYSLFDTKILKSWAGPMCGNWRPTRMNNSANKENNQEGCLKSATKRGRRTKQKEPISKWFQHEDNEISRGLVQTSKSVLVKATLCNWKIATVTLTPDYKYDQKQLLQFFHLPFTVENSKITASEDSVWEKNNFEEPVENEPELLGSSHSEAAEEPVDVSTHEVEEWDAENMVAVPVKVEKISVGKFKKPKHIDMKQLKTCIWDIISDSKTEQKEKNLQFVDLCKACPAKLPKKVADNVSVPVLFNALLHLANEKSLILTQKEGEDGFDISV